MSQYSDGNTYNSLQWLAKQQKTEQQVNNCFNILLFLFWYSPRTMFLSDSGDVLIFFNPEFDISYLSRQIAKKWWFQIP